jgi:transposase
MSKRIRFTEEGEGVAVAQVVGYGCRVSEGIERLGNKSLYTWKALFSKPPDVRAGAVDQAAEIRSVKRDLARVTGERTILTKVDASFARKAPLLWPGGKPLPGSE